MSQDTSRAASSLELDDIQVRGAITQRPSPYVAPTCWFASTTAAAGREWCDAAPLVGVRSARRLDAAPERLGLGGASPTRASGRLAFPGLLESFAPEFRQGMAARAAELGDVGDSSPELGKARWAPPDVHVAMACSAGRRAVGGMLEEPAALMSSCTELR